MHPELHQSFPKVKALVPIRVMVGALKPGLGHNSHDACVSVLDLFCVVDESPALYVIVTPALDLSQIELPMVRHLEGLLEPIHLVAVLLLLPDDRPKRPTLCLFRLHVVLILLQHEMLTIEIQLAAIKRLSNGRSAVCLMTPSLSSLCKQNKLLRNLK